MPQALGLRLAVYYPSTAKGWWGIQWFCGLALAAI